MLEIIIRLEDQERVFEAFSMDSSEAVKAELIQYLNSRVNDYEQNVEVSKAIAAYAFEPLTEIVDEPIEDPPIEEPPIEDPIEDPDTPVDAPVDAPVEDPVEDHEEPT